MNAEGAHLKTQYDVREGGHLVDLLGCCLATWALSIASWSMNRGGSGTEGARVGGREATDGGGGSRGGTAGVAEVAVVVAVAVDAVAAVDIVVVVAAAEDVTVAVGVVDLVVAAG